MDATKFKLFLHPRLVKEIETAFSQWEGVMKAIGIKVSIGSFAQMLLVEGLKSWRAKNEDSED